MPVISRADKYTALAAQQERYSDFTINFFAHPDTKQLVKVTNEEAVKRSIRNLLLTNSFERLFRPEVGGNIQKYLFEDISPVTETSIATRITDTITQYEPRAQLIDVQITGNPELNSYVITIVFSISSNPNPLTLNLTVGRVR